MSNAYDLLDRELERLHKQLALAIELSRQPGTHFNSPYGGYQQSGLTIENLWNRIIQIQDLILASYQANDKALQERIAELALVGNKSNVDS